MCVWGGGEGKKILEKVQGVRKGCFTLRATRTCQRHLHRPPCWRASREPRGEADARGVWRSDEDAEEPEEWEGADETSCAW